MLKLIMLRTDFMLRSNELINEVFEIINSKGKEYQSNQDVLSNFKDNAKDLNLTPYQIWSVYFTKHIKSIVSQIKENPTNPSNQDKVETIHSRITDAVAYLLFLNALLQDKE